MFKGFLDIFGSDLLSLFDGLFLKGLTMGYRWGHVWVIIDQLDMIWDLYPMGEMAM
jgi:hypothetical protein